MTCSLPRQPAAAPPKGFRKAIPLKTKVESLLFSLGLTAGGIEWDHDPPLAMRTWDPLAQDTIPPANDPRFIVARPIEHHRAKTSGPKTKASGRGSDQTEIARTHHLAEAQESFRRAILNKQSGAARTAKSRWPKRKMQSRSKS